MSNKKKSLNFIVYLFKKNYKGIKKEIKDLKDTRKCTLYLAVLVFFDNF